MSGFASGESRGAPFVVVVGSLCRATAGSARARGFCDPDTLRVHSRALQKHAVVAGPSWWLHGEEVAHEGTWLLLPSRAEFASL